MKKMVLISVLVTILYGPVFAQNSGPFSGFWARKSDIGTLLFYFLGNTYQLMIIEESQTASMGVFSVTNNQLKLYDTDSYKEGAAAFTYVRVDDDMLMLSKEVNDTPLVGAWVKMDVPEPPPEGVFAKLIGVWEAKGKGIVIFRVYPNGEGWCYRCSADMVLEDCWRVKFIATDSEKGKLSNAMGSFADVWIDTGEYRIAGDKLFVVNVEYTRRK